MLCRGAAREGGPSCVQGATAWLDGGSLSMRGGIVILLVGAALSVVPSSGAGSARRSCYPPDSGTIAANVQFRAYDDEDRGYSYLCEFSTGRRWRLGGYFLTHNESMGVGLVRFAGSTVAWQVESDNALSHSYDSYLSVRDFHSRRPAIEMSLMGQGRATEVVVKRNRSIAWLERRPMQPGVEENPHLRMIVRRRDAGGLVVLDEGEDEHAPHDLSLERSRLRWVRDGCRAWRASAVRAALTR